MEPLFSDSKVRPPQPPVHYWLLGGGLGCLAAAVHLLFECYVPGERITIIETDGEFSSGFSTHGDPESGYTVHEGIQPCFQEPCVERFLSYVPRPNYPGEVLLNIIENERKKRPLHPDGWVRAIVPGESGPKPLDTRKWGMRLKDRLDVARIMLESEEALGDKSIRQVFDTEFFDSTFWVLWSTTFAMQSWHSASEFRRHLLKYLPDVQRLNNAPMFGQVQFNFHECIVLPTVDNLEHSCVGFMQATTTEILFDTHDNGDLIPSRLKIQSEGRERTIPLSPIHRVIANIGPTRSKAVLGSHTTAPAHCPIIPKEVLDEEQWSLWNSLSKQGPQFGNPLNFHSRLSETTLVTFTITLKDPLFLNLYTQLTNNAPGAGAGALTTLAASTWHLTLTVPSQPVFDDQPNNVQVVWGYGLSSEREGDYIKKPMTNCTGEEIMIELLSHLEFPQEQILPNAIVIPCVIPYATSSLVTRSPGDRPQMFPDKTRNFALIGQFVELPDDTTFSMDYTVHSAQMAVYKLKGLKKEPPKFKRSGFMEVFEFLK